MNERSVMERMLKTITGHGRKFWPFNYRDEGAVSEIEEIEALCWALVSNRREASGMALAEHILKRWTLLAEDRKEVFMLILLDRFGPDQNLLDQAIKRYRSEPNPRTLLALSRAAEPRRQELIRRLILAPGGIAVLVGMRETLLNLTLKHPALDVLDADFAHLFTSWFNPGFLELRSINWSTPADILEKIIRYEAVHEIGAWHELRRRLQPDDRRCFAFFHPQLSDDPLAFVEIALMKKIPETITEVLGQEHAMIRAEEATTAVFYSISACQKGLRGISFGNFLIKQVIEYLRRELPRLDTFVTLSPVPGFAAWLANERNAEISDVFGGQTKEVFAMLDNLQWPQDKRKATALQPLLMTATAWYFLKARDSGGRIVDPVARFHLGNGARLERINFMADQSPKAMSEAHGLMVNYLYKIGDIEANHEAFACRGEVVVAPSIRRLILPQRNTRSFSSTSNTRSGVACDVRKTESIS